MSNRPYHVPFNVKVAIKTFIETKSHPSVKGHGFVQWNDPTLTLTKVAEIYNPPGGRLNKDHIAGVARALGLKFTQIGSKKAPRKPREKKKPSFDEFLIQENAVLRQDVNDILDFLTRSWPTWRENLSLCQ
jgi:hypothetical protein